MGKGMSVHRCNFNLASLPRGRTCPHSPNPTRLQPIYAFLQVVTSGWNLALLKDVFISERLVVPHAGQEPPREIRFGKIESRLLQDVPSNFDFLVNQTVRSIRESISVHNMVVQHHMWHDIVEDSWDTY